MADNPAVRIILGSITDWEKANKITRILNEVGIPIKVSIVSCHWQTGDGFEKFIRELKEDLIAYVGGMQFAAPGIAETINKVSGHSYKIVLAVPTDKIAQHACENFPQGTAVFTAGFNSISPEDGLKNSALGIAKLYAWRYPDFRPALQKFIDNMRAEKPLVREVELVNGLIPEPKK